MYLYATHTISIVSSEVIVESERERERDFVRTLFAEIIG